MAKYFMHLIKATKLQTPDKEWVDQSQCNYHKVERDDPGTNIQ